MSKLPLGALLGALFTLAGGGRPSNPDVVRPAVVSRFDRLGAQPFVFNQSLRTPCCPALTMTGPDGHSSVRLAAHARASFYGPSLSSTHPGLQYAAYPPPEPAEADGQGDDTYDVFYDQLNQDGQWYYDDEYGYVFQPAAAVDASDWRPYADGHWVWTDAGWCWVSNEPFGWACYHYGRWIRLVGVGWVWVPGTTWAPAWVSWRQGDEEVGWAPLPPECDDSPSIRVSAWCDRYYEIGPAAFCFIAFRDWARPSYAPYLAPVQNNVTIVSRTTNVTNIAYSNGVVNTFGPQAQVVSQRLGQPIPQYHLTYLGNPRARNGFATSIQGNQLRVVGPPNQLHRVASVQPEVRGRLGRPEVDRGWRGVNPAQASQLRARLAQEAPAPASLPPKPVPPPKPQFVGASAPAQPGGRRAQPGTRQPSTPVTPATGATTGPPQEIPAHPVGNGPGRTGKVNEQKPTGQEPKRPEAVQKQAGVNPRPKAPANASAPQEHPHAGANKPRQVAHEAEPRKPQANAGHHQPKPQPPSHPGQAQNRREAAHPKAVGGGHAPQPPGRGSSGPHPGKAHPATHPGKAEQKKHG